MPAPTKRLFLALTPPEPVRAEVAALASPLDGARWTRRAQLHITLRFLGSVAEDTIEAMSRRLAAIRVEPFILPVEGVGSFPPDAPPRVIWAGIGRGHPRLYQLRQKLDDTLIAGGVQLDVRTFHPHLTVARCVGTTLADVKRWLRARADFAAAPFRVDAFDLYASEPTPEGSAYMLLRRFPLTGV